MNQLLWSDELCAHLCVIRKYVLVSTSDWAIYAGGRADGRAGGRVCGRVCAQCARAVGVHSVSVRPCSFHTIFNIQFVFAFVPNLLVFWKLLNFVGFVFLSLFRVET